MADLCAKYRETIVNLDDNDFLPRHGDVPMHFSIVSPSSLFLALVVKHLSLLIIPEVDEV